METKAHQGKSFARMSKQELLEFCRTLYLEGGIEALSYPSLKRHRSLYANLYRADLSQKAVTLALGLSDEYQAYKDLLPLRRHGDRVSHRWTWKRIVAEARSISEQRSHMPPAAWFQANGYGSLVQAVYKLGKSWELLREAIGDFQQSSFVESRNGMRWRSHPEASLSNYLYARGVEHKRGERYPDDYAARASAKYAYYDLHFLAKNGEWIDVEIWGDKPNGHNEDRYRERRKDKEAYHLGKETFVGIQFHDCYSDEKLTAILEPLIGPVSPFRFDRPTDKNIPSTHWSNADELLESCRALAESMPDGMFPTEEWLRKRGKWASRDGEPLNTMAVYIRLWLGGVRNLRTLLGKSRDSTTAWDRTSAIRAYKAFYDTFGMTADQYRYRHGCGTDADSSKTAKEAANICYAVRKYAGGIVALNRELGVSADKTRRWSRDAVLNGYREVVERWGLSPNQLLNDHRTGKRKLDEGAASHLAKLIGVTTKHFSSAKEIFSILDFQPPSRPRTRKSGKGHDNPPKG